MLVQHAHGGGWPGSPAVGPEPFATAAGAAHRIWAWGVALGAAAFLVALGVLHLFGLAAKPHSWSTEGAVGNSGSTAPTATARSRQSSFSSEYWLIFLLCAVSAIEGVDMALLPSSMFALQVDLGLVPGQLAMLSLWQALLQSVAAPFWGVLADRGILTRRSILAIGCGGWGILTVLLGFVDAWSPMVLLRAANGIMLASLRPICNGLVPDIVPEGRRGEEYGKIQMSFDIGSMVGALVVTPMSTMPVAGIAGWRAAFVFVGYMSLVLALLVAATMREPPSPGAEAALGAEGASWSHVWREEVQHLIGYFRMPTFTLITAQGLFGMVPWNALGYLTLFLQTAGMSSGKAAIVSTVGRATQGVGHLLGGYVGDALAKRCPSHGRPLVAQLSVISGIPLVWVMFLGIEPGPDAFQRYCLLYGLFGLTSTWCAAGVNWPIFTEIVPPERRSGIVAWETAFEGISGALLGNLSVAWLAERLYGYRYEGAAAVVSPANARALGHALACGTIGPFVLCLAFYSMMHWSYPLDRRRAAAALAAAPSSDGPGTGGRCDDDR